MIEVASGEVTVRGVASDTILVRSVLIAQGASRDEARRRLETARLAVDEESAEVRVVLTQEGDEESRWWRKLACVFGERTVTGLDADLLVEAPPDMDLVVTLESGHVDVAGLSGTLDVSTTSGDVEIEGGARARVEVTSGNVYISDVTDEVRVDGISSNVELRRCGGRLGLDLTSGEILGRHLGGRLAIDSTAGSVRLFRVAADVEFDTTSGDLLLEDFEGSLAADTFSGSVRVAGKVDDPGFIRIETVSGNVELALLDLQAARFRLESDQGRIDAGDLRKVLRSKGEHVLLGTLGQDPGVEIRLQTRNGDITLARR